MNLALRELLADVLIKIHWLAIIILPLPLLFRQFPSVKRRREERLFERAARYKTTPDPKSELDRKIQLTSRERTIPEYREQVLMNIKLSRDWLDPNHHQNEVTNGLMLDLRDVRIAQVYCYPDLKELIQYVLDHREDVFLSQLDYIIVHGSLRPLLMVDLQLENTADSRRKVLHLDLQNYVDARNEDWRWSVMLGIVIPIVLFLTTKTV